MSQETQRPRGQSQSLAFQSQGHAGKLIDLLRCGCSPVDTGYIGGGARGGDALLECSARKKLFGMCRQIFRALGAEVGLPWTHRSRRECWGGEAFAP